MSQHKNSTISQNFSRALLAARGDRTQAEFARLLGIANQQTYQRYEKGLVPSGEILFHIATKLGVTVDTLLTGGKERKTDELSEFVPWGSELEESTQFTIALGVMMELMQSRQLFLAMKRILEHRKLSQKQKLFWAKSIGAWAVKKSELEEKETPVQETQKK